MKSIRVNRYIAMCGICSRRAAEALILKGAVSINNTTIRDLSIKVSKLDKVRVNGRLISVQKKQYILLNKPKDYITTVNDERGRKTVMDLIKNACNERVVPVGRLDRNTTGLLLFTNDGMLAKKLSHPSYKIKKVYNVSLDKKLNNKDILRILNGLKLEDGLIMVDSINYINQNKKNIQIEVHVGRNRIIRRIFEFLNYKVLKLDRVQYGFLTKKNLSIGEWRMLTKEELDGFND